MDVASWKKASPALSDLIDDSSVLPSNWCLAMAVTIKGVTRIVNTHAAVGFDILWQSCPLCDPRFHRGGSCVATRWVLRYRQHPRLASSGVGYDLLDTCQLSIPMFSTFNISNPHRESFNAYRVRVACLNGIPILLASKLRETRISRISTVA